jgi:hypothetical protein
MQVGWHRMQAVAPGQAVQDDHPIIKERTRTAGSDTRSRLPCGG